MKKAFFLLKNMIKSILAVAMIGMMTVVGILIYVARGGSLEDLPVALQFVLPDRITVGSETEAANGQAIEGRRVRLQEDGTAEEQEQEALGSLPETEAFVESQKLLLESAQADSYAYNQLAEDEQALYLEILWAILEFREDMELSSMDSEEIARIFQCVLNDHPEIFYIDGYTYTQYTLGDILKKITFSASYNMDQDEIVRRQGQIDAYVEKCFAGMPVGADEYEVVKYIYEYLIDNTEYDAEAEDNQNICSVFLDGRSVCQGYAKATQYLLGQAGIRATLVLGKVSAGEGHAWNLVQINGEWYYVDTTWGDASYQAVGGESSYPENKMPTINYDYLCVTSKQLCKTHVIDNVVEMPECNAVRDNYYVREGLYFIELDEVQLEHIFQDGYEKGSAYVTFKCDSEELYRQMQERLIHNQEIFRYLDCPDGIVSYTDNEEQYSMSFWL